VNREESFALCRRCWRDVNTHSDQSGRRESPTVNAWLPVPKCCRSHRYPAAGAACPAMSKWQGVRRIYWADSFSRL